MGVMRTLDIDWADLEIAFRDGGSESFLDLTTGEVVTIVEGFDDERDIRDRLARQPQRYARIPPVDKAWSMALIAQFANKQRGALRQQLDEAQEGVGALSRCTTVLRDDKAASSAWARFEQAALLKHIEAFLNEHEVACREAAPHLELFENFSG